MHANAGTTTLTHRWRWLLVLGVVQIIAGSMAIAIPIVASFAAVAIFWCRFAGDRDFSAYPRL